MGEELNLLPPPREFCLQMWILGAVVLDVSMELLFPVKISTFHAMETLIFHWFFAQERPKCISITIRLRAGSVIWSKISLGGGGTLIQWKPAGKCFTEMRNLLSDFAGFGCGHAEPCRCSKRAILFSFLVHLSFLSGFRAQTGVWESLSLKNSVRKKDF